MFVEFVFVFVSLFVFVFVPPVDDGSSKAVWQSAETAMETSIVTVLIKQVSTMTRENAKMA